MKAWFGLHLPRYTFEGAAPEQIFDRILDQVRVAEEYGFAQLTVMDHLYQIPGVGSETEPMLEAYSVLAALARETSRVRLGAMVSGVTYRNPALLAKSVTALDVISGGRAMLGLGAAWFEAEHVGLGYPFPAVRERMDRLDEALTIVRAMFREERPSFEGSHYRVERVVNSPPPVQPGGPPILVGGGGEQRTLRICARHADMAHWFASDGIDGLRRKNALLDGYCHDIGRDPAEIERTTAAPVVPLAPGKDGQAVLDRMSPERRANVVAGSPSECAERLRPYLDAGYTGFTFNNSVFRTPDEIRAVGETLQLLTA